MRKAVVSRKTKETDITVELCLDGGNISIQTGIGFFDHMLCSLATHAGVGLICRAQGDLHVDCHHLVEDVGIVLGQAFAQALGDKVGIGRFADCILPMDEALVLCALDIGGRAFLVFDAAMPQERCGTYDTCMTEEFMRAFAFNAGVNLHIKCFYGSNAHHITEAIFKALARCIRSAVKVDGKQLLSTKGVI